MIAGLLLASSGWALAGLGREPEVVESHTADTDVHAVSTGLASYTDRVRRFDSGTTTHEYVDVDGLVFAVSWSGPSQPDLRQLLGDYFSTMVAAARAQPNAGRAALWVQRADVVIVSGGHIGAFEGKAWLPNKLPSGFNPEGIK